MSNPNPNTRKRAIQRVLSALPDNEPAAWNENGSPNPEFVSDQLSFDTSDQEIAGFGRWRYGKAPSKPVPAAVQPAPAHVDKQSVPIAPVPQPTGDAAIATAEAAVKAAERALDLSRGRLGASQREVKAARGRLAVALSSWQAGLTPRTPESVAREMIAANQEMKRQIAAGEVDPNAGRTDAPGPSHIDRMTFGARGSRDRSYSRSYARGALPASARGQYIAPRADGKGCGAAERAWAPAARSRVGS